MTHATLEHVNVTVADADKTAQRLCDLFGWHIRWAGEGMGGRSVHVGMEDFYLAVYAPGHAIDDDPKKYGIRGGLNHIGVVVDDIDATEQHIKDAGYKPGSHADYEPGRRFYFEDEDGIEFEVVSYK